MTNNSKDSYIKEITDYYKTIKNAEDFLTTEEFWEKIPCVVVYEIVKLIRFNRIAFEVLTPPF